MTRRDPRGRPGITLTEILISIMILGIGMVSLATLFPIGLLRIRAAEQASSSVKTGKLAINEIGVRNLFDKANFNFYSGLVGVPIDVWTTDGGPGAVPGPPILYNGVQRFYGAGLPVAYDPLWWSVIGRTPTLNNFRFGASTYTMTADPAGSTSRPAADGLQRLTGSSVPLGPLEGIFVAPDNFVTQPNGGPNMPPPTGPAAPAELTGASPLVPDLSSGNLQFDYAYTWMFTGQQSDAGDYSVFDGSIVVFNNRPFGVEGTTVTGERVVEAVFAPGKPNAAAPTYTYSTGDPRVVWLRWPNTQPDPAVAVGSWIADVTYGASPADDNARNGNLPPPPTPSYPHQRCFWYQVARRADADVDPTNNAFRRMTVTLASPVRAKTLLRNDGSGTPAYTNAALLCPSVVNVFPRTFYNRR